MNNTRHELRRLVRKTGKKIRILYAYREDSRLREQHAMYARFMCENFYPSIFTHAYVHNRSIYTNSVIHINNDYFVKLDVRNFFPNLSHKILTERMYEELNRQDKNTIELNECAEIVKNCSVNNTGIPLGLITSPILSNIYMKKFDNTFYGKLRKLGIENVLYTRYADDMFISFRSDDAGYVEVARSIIRLCENELHKVKLDVNKHKTKVINLNKSNHVKIAGINIVGKKRENRRLTVSRSVIKEMYFEAMNIYRGPDNNETIDTARINYIKGMHSFVLSIEKRGYSHVLSDKMKQSVRQLGYESLEELIRDFKINK